MIENKGAFVKKIKLIHIIIIVLVILSMVVIMEMPHNYCQRYPNECICEEYFELKPTKENVIKECVEYKRLKP